MYSVVPKWVSKYCFMMILVLTMHLHHFSQRINDKCWFGWIRSPTELIQEDLWRIVREVYCPQNIHNSNSSTRASSPSFWSQNGSRIRKGCAMAMYIHGHVCILCPGSFNLGVCLCPSRPDWLRDNLWSEEVLSALVSFIRNLWCITDLPLSARSLSEALW